MSYFAPPLDAFDEATATERNGGPPVPPAIRAALDAARAGWRTDGHQAEVDEALAVIAEYEAFEPELCSKRLAERFRVSTVLRQQVQPVDRSPPRPPRLRKQLTGHRRMLTDPRLGGPPHSLRCPGRTCT